MLIEIGPWGLGSGFRRLGRPGPWPWSTHVTKGPPQIGPEIGATVLQEGSTLKAQQPGNWLVLAQLFWPQVV